MKGKQLLRGPLESQTTGPQTNNEPLADLLHFCAHEMEWNHPFGCLGSGKEPTLFYFIFFVEWMEMVYSQFHFPFIKIWETSST